MRSMCVLILIVLFGLTSGDIENDIIEGPSFRIVPYPKDARWPGGIVPYDYQKGLGEISSDKMQQVEEEMEKLEKYTSSGNTSCIRFRKKTDRDVHYLRVLGGRFCSASVGYDESSSFQSVSVGGCSRQKLFHELMHVLGFFHEHNRPDRDRYVKILWKSIVNRNQYEINANSFNQSLPYDFGSILHYDRGIQTKTRDYIGGRRKALGRPMSDLDVIRVQRFYSCKEDVSTLHRYFPVDIVFECSFKDFCNMTQETDDDFDWSRGDTKVAVTTNGQTTRQVYNSYLYINAKMNPRKKAAMRTPVIENGTYCFSLAVSVQGFRGGGRLLVQAVPSGSGDVADLLDIDYAFDSWDLNSRTFSMKSPWYLRMEATAPATKPKNIEVRDLLIRRC